MIHPYKGCALYQLVVVLPKESFHAAMDKAMQRIPSHRQTVSSRKKNDSALAAMQARRFFIPLYNHPQDKPVIFYGELAVAAQLFGDIQYALNTIAVAFPEGGRDPIPEKWRFFEGIFHT